MRRLGGKHCYYCGKPATSVEHLPPKQMFKTFQCDSLTVPSCDEHNSKKGGHDQAVVSALLIPLHTGRHRYPLEPEIEQAINDALPSFEMSKKSAVRSSFLKDPPSGLEDLPDLAHLAPSVDFPAWLRQLTAGLVHKKIGTASYTVSWQKATTWSPHWFPTSSPTSVPYDDVVQILEKNQKQRAILDNLAWQPGWSAHPKPYPKIIYSFQIHVFPDKYVMFRHTFYNRYTWYVTFKASKRCISKLLLNL